MSGLPLTSLSSLTRQTGQLPSNAASVVPASFLLALGQLAPLPLLVVAAARPDLLPPAPAVLAAVFSWLPRAVAARRFDQPWDSVLLHPVGVLLLLVVQWQAFANRLLGRPADWKGRSYSAIAVPQSRG